MRQRHITTTYAETVTDYARKVLTELPRLQQATGFFEVVLWFDADLMCQVNFLYLVQELSRQKVKLISYCTPAPFGSLGLLPTAKLATLFGERKQLQDEQLQQAQTLWDLYAGPEPLKLQQFLQSSESALPYTKQAMALHLSLFPDCEIGLSAPHQQLLQLIKQGATTLQELVKQYALVFPAYGFGDWQLLRLLRQLQPALLNQQEPYKLTHLGYKILDREEKYLEWLEKKPYLGGYRLSAENFLCYDRKKNLLAAPSQLK